MATGTPDIVTNPLASAQTALAYGPQTQQALRRSQYLADALRTMTTEGAQNIRSPAELATKLLATAILQHGNNKSQDALIQAMTADRQGYDRSLLVGTPLDPTATPPAAASPPPPEPPSPAAPTPPPAPQASAGLSDADRLNMARAVWGEARGEPAAGQQGVAAVILNRARQSGQSPSAVVAAPHQFAGFGPQARSIDPAQLQPILANINPVIDGSAPDPTGGADHFFNPALANPSWGQGDGQMIGHHKFMHLGDGGSQAPSTPPGAPGPQGVPQPYQIAANGPTPPPPQGVAPGAGPQAPLGPPPVQAQPAPQAAGIPHQVVTPEEWQQAASLLGNWRTHDLGVQKLMELKFRAAAPVEDPSKPYWGADGRAHYAPGTESTVTPGTLPGTYMVRSPQNDLKVVSEPNLTNGPPPGYDRDPVNPNRLIPQGTGSGLPVASGAHQAPAAPQAAPAGKAPIPPALQKPFMDTLDAFHKAPGYTDYVNSANAANALEANLKASLGNNTIVDQTAVDATIRAMTGLSARQGSVNAVLEHLPWSDQLKGFIAHAVGPDGMNGYITPKVLQQMRTAVHAYADGHRQLAEQEYGQYNSGANRMGFDLGQDLPTVMPQAAIRWMDTGVAPPPAPSPRAAPPAPYGLSRQPTAQEIDAEIARRRAAGGRK